MEYKTSRIEALSDGIFAVSMTLLIFGFGIMFQPQKSIGNSLTKSDAIAPSLKNHWFL
ncbi:MAG: TMEM175 family protein [Candidatus Ancaeobacter aquaticus]|nr:TMEM175 family protein [Candidatus Ancaeobacter aquaticus]